MAGESYRVIEAKEWIEKTNRMMGQNVRNGVAHF